MAAGASALRGDREPSVQEVNQLLRQYAQMRKMFKSMSKPSFAKRLAGMKMPGM